MSGCKLGVTRIAYIVSFTAQAQYGVLAHITCFCTTHHGLFKALCLPCTALHVPFESVLGSAARTQKPLSQKLGEKNFLPLK